jgi:sulfur-oxidizing protein SoxZ
MAEPMRIRATMAGDVADVKVLMNHPMETGLRKDAKTGQLVPAHYITDVTATINGANVLAKAGDKVVVNWVDNTGDKNTAEAAIG